MGNPSKETRPKCVNLKDIENSNCKLPLDLLYSHAYVISLDDLCKYVLKQDKNIEYIVEYHNTSPTEWELYCKYNKEPKNFKPLKFTGTRNQLYKKIIKKGFTHFYWLGYSSDLCITEIKTKDDEVPSSTRIYDEELWDMILHKKTVEILLERGMSKDKIEEYIKEYKDKVWVKYNLLCELSKKLSLRE